MLLSKTACGFAFEVDIKKTEGVEVMTPVRARLEKQASDGRALPRLLRSTRDQEAKGCSESPMKEVAAKARARNEEKRATAQRAKQDLEKLMDQKRVNLESALEKASEHRQTSLTERSSKAGEHFEKVKAKVGDLQRQQADAAMAHQRSLEEDLAQKDAAHNTGVAKRRTKAGEHNDQVAEKVQESHVKNQQRLEKLRKQLQEREQKAKELREQQLRKGNTDRVSSRPASAPVTPAGKIGMMPLLTETP
jgi:hypothetical protein